MPFKRTKALTEQLFLTSPRNSVAAQISLFKRPQCKTLISFAPRPPAVTAIIDSQDFRVVEVPGMEYFLDIHHPHVPFTRNFGEGALRPFFCRAHVWLHWHTKTAALHACDCGHEYQDDVTQPFVRL